jgi:hypothetical protein
MSLKNKTVPFRFLSESMGDADIAHFAMSAASGIRRHAKRQHVCATRPFLMATTVFAPRGLRLCCAALFIPVERTVAVKRRLVPVFRGDVFDQRFRRNVDPVGEIDLRGKPIENLPRDFAAYAGGKLVAAEKESFDQLQIIRSHARQADARAAEWRDLILGVDSMQRALPFRDRLANDDRAGHVIAQAAGLPVQQSADDAHGVNAWHAIDNP